MVTAARSTDPEAVWLMAELAARGDVQDDFNPLGNYLLELWDVSDEPDVASRIERVFAGLAPEYLAFLSLPVEIARFRRLDVGGARIGLVRLLRSGLQYFPAYEDQGTAEAFVGRLQAWLGPSAEYLFSYGSVFRVPHWVDESFAFASPGRAGFLWCLGTD